MNHRLTLCLAALALSVLSGPATSTSDTRVVGEKLDSNLGQLPHYSQWADPTGRHPLGYKVAGESLDDGLGELPVYALWLDRTGRDPMGKATRVTVAGR